MYPSFSHKLSYYSPASHPSFAQSKLPIRILNKLGKQSAHDWSLVYSTPVLWSEKKKFSWYFIKLISFILMSFQQMAFVTTLCQAVFGTGNRWDPSLSSSGWPFWREVGGNIIDASLAEYSPREGWKSARQPWGRSGAVSSLPGNIREDDIWTRP